MAKPEPVFKSLRWKRWRQRWSISAPRVKIKNHLPWPLRAVFIAIVVGLGGAVAMWTYDLGRNFTGFKTGASAEQIAQMQSQIKQVGDERDQLQATINASDSQLNMERSLQEQLKQQVKSLEEENGKLKDDLSFYESLLPSDAAAKGIAIRRLKVEMVSPTQVRYQVLVMQGGKVDHDFIGNYQVVMTLVQGGKSAMMTLPKPDAADKYKLAFRHYQRVDGVLAVPDGAIAKSVQVRILEKGAIRTQQSENL
jgi:TolA-binding protein